MSDTAVVVPAAPAQGGHGTQAGGYTPPAPASQRARVGDFSSFSAQGMPGGGGLNLAQSPVTPGADGLPGQQIGLQNPQLIDRPYDANDPFRPLVNEDAQAQTLALHDGPDPLAPIDPNTEAQSDESVQAELVTAEQLRAELEERRAWLEGDDLPELFMDKFGIATVNGQRYRIPVSEAFKGYQRNEDYSTKLRAMYEHEQGLMQREAGLQKLLTDMDDGQKFLDAMVFLGKFKGFSEAAILYGTQLDAERRMTPEQRQVHQAMRAQRAENQRLQMELRAIRGQQMQLQAQQQQPQQPQGPNSDQVRAIYEQQLAHLAPKIAQKLGFVNTPIAQQEFERHFNLRLPSIYGSDLTSEFVEDVMQAAMESVEAHLARSGYVLPTAAQEQPAQRPGQPRIPAGNPQGGQWTRAQQQAAQRRAELPPVSTGSGPTQLPNGANGGRPQRMRIGDFDRAVRNRV